MLENFSILSKIVLDTNNCLSLREVNRKCYDHLLSYDKVEVKNRAATPLHKFLNFRALVLILTGEQGQKNCVVSKVNKMAMLQGSLSVYRM